MGGEDRVVRGAADVDFGKMEGKRVARDSTSPETAARGTGRAVGHAAGGPAGGVARLGGRWRAGSAGGGWQSSKRLP